MNDFFPKICIFVEKLLSLHKVFKYLYIKN